MKISREPLFSALVKMSALDKRASLPIRSCAKISSSGKECRLSFSDLDNWMTVDLPCVGKLECATQLAKLKAFCGQSKADEITLELSSQRLQASDGTSTAKLDIIPIEDAPEFPEVPKLQEADPSLLRAFKACLPCASTDETRYVLNGVFVEGDRAVAADSRRLTVCELDCKFDKPAILARAGVAIILSAMEGCESLLCALENTKAHFSSGETTLTVNLIDGIFPNWKQVIPTDPKWFPIDREFLVASLESAKIFTTEKICSVEIESGGKEIAFRVGKEEFLSLSAQSLPPFKTCLVPQYPLDFLKVCTSKTIDMALADHLSPVMFRDGKLLGLIMPLRMG